VTRSPELLVIVGPTGTGKSGLAVRVAERVGGEIIGCDAIQVYRGLDVATAKATADERDRVPHHLVDCVAPSVDYTLADYVRDADRAVADVAGRGRTPIVVGGTGLYLRGLLRGVIEAPARQPVLRARLHRLADRHGPQRLHRWLCRLDPGTASRLGPGDSQRIVRAIELGLSGGTWSRRLAEQGTWSDSAERYPTRKFGLDCERETLHARLDARVLGFFERGLVDEVRRLLASGLAPEANAFKAIGYREVIRALAAGDDPALVREQVARNTRRYAKRQRTWFRSEPGVRWLDAARGEDLADEIARSWRGGQEQAAGS